MKEKLKIISIIGIFLVATAVLAVFEFAEIRLCDDQTANGLWIDTIPRLITGAAATAALVFLGYGHLFRPLKKGWVRALVWCLPCVAVCLVNFPFSALLCGDAAVERPDLIWLFALKCFSIGWMEEALFRGILLCLISEWQKESRYREWGTLLLTSAIFSLYHLFNLFGGADVGATLLQVGYSFLTGAMFAAVLLRTKNIWICIFLHALFDFGGLLIPEIGTGAAQDNLFWILTAVAGAVCFAHILRWLLGFIRPHHEKPDDERTEEE